MMQKSLLLLFVLLLFGPVPRGAAQSSRPTLKKVAEFDLPGPSGKRFDYLTIDPDDHYLLSAHLGAGQTYVINLRSNKVVATVKDTPGAEGVEYVPELKKVYTSDWHEQKIGVIDLRQGKVIGFAAFEATMRGFFGPTGVAETERGKDIGKALLILAPLLVMATKWVPPLMAKVARMLR